MSEFEKLPAYGERPDFQPMFEMTFTKVRDPKAEPDFRYMDVLEGVKVNQDFLRLDPYEQREIINLEFKDVISGKTYADCHPSKMRNTLLRIPCDGVFAKDAGGEI